MNNNNTMIKWIIAILCLVVLGLLSAPFFISEPDLQKAIAKDLTFIAAGLIVLAAVCFLVSMIDVKRQILKAAASGKTSKPFSDNSLFDAKIRAMHERARKGMHMYPEGHICQTKIHAMDMLTRAVDPDDIIVDCYGSDAEGFRTRFYGSLDGGTSWYELLVPSSPADRKTLLKVALGLASVHDFASKVRMEHREKVVAGTDAGRTPISEADWNASSKEPDREERTMGVKDKA